MEVAFEGVVIGPKTRSNLRTRRAGTRAAALDGSYFFHALHTASEPVHVRILQVPELYTYDFIRIRFYPRLDPPGENARVGF